MDTKKQWALAEEAIKDSGRQLVQEEGAIMDTKKQLVQNENSTYMEELRQGAELFERFWLQPVRYMDQEVKLRLKINKKFGGWKVKDELVERLGLQVGDCINTEVSVELGPGIIDDDGDTDLFADGKAAEWLVDTVLNDTKNKNRVEDRVIDCVVRFSYCRAPVGPKEKEINKVTLVLVKGLESNGIEKRENIGAIGQKYIERLLASM